LTNNSWKNNSYIKRKYNNNNNNIDITIFNTNDNTIQPIPTTLLTVSSNDSSWMDTSYNFNITSTGQYTLKFTGTNNSTIIDKYTGLTNVSIM
jgi:hypothetical protein